MVWKDSTGGTPDVLIEVDNELLNHIRHHLKTSLQVDSRDLINCECDWTASVGEGACGYDRAGEEGNAGL